MQVTEIPYKRVTIVGSGLLGHAIGLVHAMGGCDVILNDLTTDALEKAVAQLAITGDVIVSTNGATREEVDAAISRISACVDLKKAVSGADLVVEAISEDVDAKRRVFEEIDRWAPAPAIIASNTSHLDVFPLFPGRRLSNALIVHWYTPPYIVDLVDIVGSPKASPATVETMKNFLVGLGKRPVVLKAFVSGYIANRLQAAISLEIFSLIDQGIATPEDIDTSIKYGIAERMIFLGHLMKCDYSGVALIKKTLANKTYVPPVVRGRSDAVDSLVASGRLGIVSGAGFYDYGGRSEAELVEERDRKLFALKNALKAIGRN
ncbi:3-hydroxyacyl-CoA dehydrogenase family protein [Mesorhizobium sp. B3-1-3]|uniref:3-hydroxyacyl-CoA dehydrogenase family protein n=1 Tax=unclassified Mesorhizobium TaxID=325217 RepID=UPI001127C21F|nr:MULTISPECIES: 3-hydroxyacyl-CoA dehydrogenase family protein [unclassified Mesorhizobium]TPI61458.1 3-hydroxyacyl-CoA dehydrogenase family protein [Mesorhizobium sp. B3-1-8]TPI70591.1 3-hydroxyacyl-CoA dehydrogenase family protein [Mesorhizobium sp. B3-1-3]